MSLQDLFSEKELALLRQRAERVAAPLRDERSRDRLTALIVMMHGEKYALPIDLITVVYRDVVVIPVPCVPNFVAGMANVRGHLVSVLDLAAVLGVEGANNDAESALVVAAAADANIGLRVEVVGEVVDLAISQMNPVPPNMNLAQAEYLQGIFPDGTALLNLKAVLDDKRLVVDDATV